MNEPELIEEHLGVILLTAEGHDNLQAELARLTSVARVEIADRIRESQQHGEFSEDNSELDQVKTEQAFVENRIAELRVILSNSQILTPELIPVNHIGIGSLVKVEDVEFGDTFEVRLVSSIEADPTRDFLSSESPMGLSLFGASVGDTVAFQAPDGLKKFKVHSISR